jgi:antitoxin PrlF
LEEPEIAVVGTKGQIVIPQRMRRELAITANTKLAIYRKDDKLVLMKLQFPTVGRELEGLFNEIDEKNRGRKAPNDREILKEIQTLRKERADKGA